MPFTIENALANADIRDALVQNNVTDAAAQRKIIEEVFNKAPHIANVDEASAIVSTKAMIPAAVTSLGAQDDAAKVTTPGVTKGGMNTEQSEKAAASIMNSADIATNRASTYLSDILASKPAAAERIGTQTTMVLKKPNDSSYKKFKSYKENQAKETLSKKEYKLVDTAENIQAYEEAMGYIEKARNGETVEIPLYVSSDSKPVVLGYEFKDAQGVAIDMTKKKNTLCAFLAFKFAGLVPVNPTTKLGAYLRSIKVKTGNYAGQTRTNAVIAGAKDYWVNTNNKGKATYEVSNTETEDLSVRSDLSFKVVNGEGKERTVRLYGTVKVSKVTRLEEFVKIFGEMVKQPGGGSSADTNLPAPTAGVIADVMKMISKDDIAPLSADLKTAFEDLIK